MLTVSQVSTTVVGNENIETALASMRILGFLIVANDTSGFFPRKQLI